MEQRSLLPFEFFPVYALTSEDNTTVQLPLDFRQTAQFRRLKALFSAEKAEPEDEMWAVFVWAVLWQELGYRAQEGTVPGRLPAEDVPLLLKEFVFLLDQPQRQALLEQLVQPVKLLVKDGGDYVCPRFAIMNASMGHSGRTRYQRAADMKHFRKRQEAAQQGSMDTLLIPPERLVDVEGVPLDQALIRRLGVFIRGMDAALYQKERPRVSFAFGSALIQNAAAVLEKFTDEEIDQAMGLMARNRGHPLLEGLTTEKLLPDFEKMVRQLAPIE